MALPTDDLVLGRLADRARVDDDEVGGLERWAPRRSRRRAGAPAISSESLWFIWQPSVQIGKRGRDAASGRYSSTRASATASEPRGAAARRGGTTSRTGSARAMRRSSVTARHRTPGRRRATVSSVVMDLLTNPETWIALLTLTVLEIVLGIDNVIFISILVQRLPATSRDRARLIGLGLAMLMRILLLLTISWIVGLTAPVVTRPGARVLVARPDPRRRWPVPALEGDDGDRRVARGRAGPPRRDPAPGRRRSAASWSRSCSSTWSSPSIRC